MTPEAIYKGATRPAMRWGVPLVPLVVLLGSGALLVMWIGPFFSWWIAPIVVLTLGPAMAWMRHATRRDDQRLSQLVLLLKLSVRDRNHRLWRSRSYSPTLYRRLPDAWFR